MTRYGKDCKLIHTILFQAERFLLHQYRVRDPCFAEQDTDIRLYLPESGTEGKPRGKNNNCERYDDFRELVAKEIRQR